MTQPHRKHVLFVCEGNVHRSPTAEALYAHTPGLAVRSAGLSELARTRVTEELLEWADVVFVMERRFARQITRRFPDVATRATIISLDIPDDFQRDQPGLIALLRERLEQHLGLPASGEGASSSSS